MATTNILSVPAASFSAAQLPELNFSHIKDLTDETGMIQHAVYSMPNRKEGYCIDDNARALLLMVWACKDKSNPLALRLLPIYLSFIHYMQTDSGEFKNFMNYDKVCPEEQGSEDSFGRTMMALGFLTNEGPTHLLARTGAEIFSRAYRHIEKLGSPRAIASTAIGLSQFIKFNYPDDIKEEKLVFLADKLVAMYKANNVPGWHWFESVMTYDNAILPLALLNAYEVTQQEVYLSIALESMHFLESKVMKNGCVRPIGNHGWLEKGGKAAQYDQQGIDVLAMVLYYQQAFRLTREEQYLNSMYTCYQWFLGANDLKVPLYDPATGGCADGLQVEGINFNQGAESTLAYWMSHLVVMAGLKE